MPLRTVQEGCTADDHQGQSIQLPRCGLALITKGKVRLTMSKHIQNIMNTAPIDMDGLTETLSIYHLFQVQ